MVVVSVDKGDATIAKSIAHFTYCKYYYKGLSCPRVLLQGCQHRFDRKFPRALPIKPIISIQKFQFMVMDIPQTI